MLCDLHFLPNDGLMQGDSRTFFKNAIQIKRVIAKLGGNLRITQLLVVILSDIDADFLHELGQFGLLGGVLRDVAENLFDSG